MKCYACEEEIEELTRHCPNCGALLEPSNKLINAVNDHNEEAVVQLYKMEAHRIYTMIREKGIDEDVAKSLINPTFSELLKQLPTLTDEKEFETLLEGISENAAYQYIVENGLEIKETVVDDFLLPVDDETIKELFYGKKSETGVTKKKKSKGKLIIVVVIIALLIGSVGAFGYYKYSGAKKKKSGRALKAYAVVAEDYQNVSGMGNVSESVIERQHPKVYKAMQVVKNNSYDNEAHYVPRQLTVSLKDLNHDGNQELILGFIKDQKNYVTGIYHYNQKKKTATAYNLFSKAENYKGTIVTDKNHLIVLNKKNKGTVYSLQGGKLKTIQSNVSDTDSYLKRTNEKKITLPTSSVSSVIKQYNEATGSHKTSVINQTYNANKTVSQYDLDGDGKKDQIKLSYMSSEPLAEDYGGYYNVTINGLVFKVSCDEYIDGYLSIIRASNGAMFILTHTEGMDEYSTWTLSAYKNKQLVTLQKTARDDIGDTGDYFGYQDYYVDGNQLIVTEKVNSAIASIFNITYVFNLSKDQAQLVSKEHQIYSPGFNSLDKTQLVLKTARTISTYKTNKCEEKGIEIPAGVKLTIQTIQVMGDYDAYKITYKGQTGFIKSDSDGYNKYFSNLEYYD